MKLLAKIAAIAASAVLAASAFGCGSSDSSAKSGAAGFEPESIQVNDAGFAITEEGTLRYAFVAVNPNDGHVAQDVVFTIEAYDADGSMIAGGGETIPVLYPGVETAGAGETQLFSQSTDTPEVANLSIVPMMDSAAWSDTKVTAEECEDMVKINNPRMLPADENLDIKAKIELASGDDAPAGTPSSMDLRAVAVLFDDSGSAICGTSAVTFTVNADGSYDYNATIMDAPDYGECNLYVTPSGII